MNNCEAYKAFIASYIEGQLNETDRDRLEEHIESCSACSEEYAQAQKLAMVLGESFRSALSAEQAADSVLNSISQLPKSEKIPFSFLTFGKIAACILFVTGLALSFYAGHASTQWKPDGLAQAPYTIETIEGAVLVKHSNSDIWQPLSTDSTIYTDDRLLSTPGAHITLAVNENSSVELKENSLLIFDITPDETNLLLVHGMLDAELASPHGPFFVTTPHGRAEAMGTEFTVKVD